MLRFTLFIFLLLTLYYALHVLIKDTPSFGRTIKRKNEAEELVQDPYCQTYIPKRSALRKRLFGRNYYFCKKECLEKFIQNENLQKS
jgi:YHS domain-containing protein